MKKILIVSGSLRIGGLENIAMNFRRFSSRNEYNIDYLVYGEEIGGYEEEAKKCGCKVIHINKPGNNYCRFRRELKEAILKHGPYDIVHSHTFFMSGIVVKTAKECGVNKCITHVHSGKRTKDDNLDKKIKYYFLRKWINKYSDVRCACSKRAGEYVFGKELFDKNGIVIPNVIDLEKFRYNAISRKKIRNELHIDDDCFVIGNVGHMLPVKNQVFLINLFSEYAKNNSKAKLVIVGDGIKRNEIERSIIDKGISDKVVLTGTRNDVNEIMSSFDVFILPSLHEGLPVTLVEAMANGLTFIIEENVVADELKEFVNCMPVKGYSVNEWIRAISHSESIARYDSQLCIEELEPYSINSFVNIIKKIY